MSSVVSQQINDKALNGFQILVYSKCFMAHLLYFLFMLYRVNGSLFFFDDAIL